MNLPNSPPNSTSCTKLIYLYSLKITADLAPLVPAIQTYMAQLADEVQARHLDKAVEAQSKVRFQVGSANTTGSVVVADNLSKLFSQASGPACAGPAVLLSNRILPTLLHLLSPPGATQFNTPTVTNFPAGADHYTHDVLNVAAAWTAGVNGKTAPFSGNSFLRFTARDGARGQDVAVYYHAGLRVFLVFELRQPNGQATTATSTTDSAAPSATNGTANSTSVPTFTPQTNSVFGTGDGAVNIQHLMTDEAMQLTTDPAAALEALTSSNQLPNAAGSAAPGTPSDVSTATTALGTVNHESQSRPQGHSLVEGRLLSAWPVNVPTETYVPAPPEVQVGFWVHLAWHFLCRNFNLTCHAPIIDMSLNSLSQAYGTAQKSYFGRDVASSSTLAHSSAVVSNVSALDLPSNHADAYSRPTTSTATGTAKPFPMLGLPPC